MCHLYFVYNNNYSFVILICLQLFCQPHLFVIFLARLFAFLLTTFLKAIHLFLRPSQILKHSIITDCLLLNKKIMYLDCSVLPLYSPISLVKRTFLKQKVLVVAFSRTLLQPFVYVHSHTCFSFKIVVGRLFERYSIYLLVYSRVVCSAYTFPVVVWNVASPC